MLNTESLSKAIVERSILRSVLLLQSVNTLLGSWDTARAGPAPCSDTAVAVPLSPSLWVSSLSTFCESLIIKTVSVIVFSLFFPIF